MAPLTTPPSTLGPKLTSSSPDNALSSTTPPSCGEVSEVESSAQLQLQFQLLNNQRHQLQSKIEDLTANGQEQQKRLKEIEVKLLHALEEANHLRQELREKSNSIYTLIKLSAPLHRAVKYPFTAFFRRKPNKAKPKPKPKTKAAKPTITSIDHATALVLLKNSIDPVSTLNTLLLSEIASTEVLGNAIEKLFNDRTGTLLRMSQSQTEVSSARLALLIKLYSYDFQGLLLEAHEFEQIINDLYQGPNPPSYTTEAVLLRFAIKSQSMAIVASVSERLRSFKEQRLPGSCKIGVLRLAAKDPESYRQWRGRLNLSPIEELQIVELDVQVGLIERTSHSKVTESLKAVAAPEVVEDLNREVLPFFDRFQERCRWLEVRVDSNQRTRFLDLIRQHIEEKRPLSLIRLGDGESYAWSHAVSDDRASTRERMWWGDVLPRPLRSQISSEILAAIQQADILGVPSIFRIARDLNPSIKSLFGEPSRRELLIVLQGVSELPPSERTFTEERVHQICFDLPNVLDLAQKAKKLVVISSIVPHAIMKCFNSIQDRVPIETIVVSTHTKTSQNSLFINSEEKLPHTYSRIVDRIGSVVEPGTLVLVASGSIGKIFCHAAQRAGGVVLDVGAMADYWVGVKTRSIADLI